jgi:endonuclease-8
MTTVTPFKLAISDRDLDDLKSRLEGACWPVEVAPESDERGIRGQTLKSLAGHWLNTYDWRTDIMSDLWDEAHVRRQLRAMPGALVCDALLDQTVFTGVGNIIKNEVLFRIRLHPLSVVGALPAAKLRELVAQARQYGFEFLEWKKANVLKQHWLAHTKRICPRCKIPFVLAELGKTKRRSFFCERCQKRYDATALP